MKTNIARNRQIDTSTEIVIHNAIIVAKETGVNNWVCLMKNSAGYSEVPGLNTDDLIDWLEGTGLTQEQLCDLVQQYSIWD